MARSLAAALAATLVGTPAFAQVRIEYVAHACFVVESPGGVRALVDPYNGRSSGSERKRSSGHQRSGSERKVTSRSSDHNAG
jgi:hypothetical protein